MTISYSAAVCCIGNWEPFFIGEDFFGAGGLNLPSEFTRESFDEGEDLGEKLIPAGDLAEAGFLEVGGGRGGVDSGLEDAQAAGAVFEMGIDAIAEVTAGELAQAGLGGEVFFADTGQVDLVHGAERAKPAQSLACGSATELQAGLHIVERERFRCAEEESVNFTDGARQRESSKDMNKKCDGLELKGAEWSRRR